MAEAQDTGKAAFEAFEAWMKQAVKAQYGGADPDGPTITTAQLREKLRKFDEEEALYVRLLLECRQRRDDLHREIAEKRLFVTA